MTDPPREGRTTPFTAADRATLRRLIDRHPDAPRSRIRALFEARSGRPISGATLDRITRPWREPPGPDEVVVVAPPPPRPSGNEALSDAHRAALVRLLRRHPGATAGRIALLLRLETGRSYSGGAIYYARRHLDRFAEPGKHFRFLTDTQRGALARIIAESDPATPAREVARLFAEETGRAITDKTARYFRHQVLGLPKVGQGRNSHVGRASIQDRRIAEASRRKLAAAPVDHSPRPGRTGRVREGDGCE